MADSDSQLGLSRFEESAPWQQRATFGLEGPSQTAAALPDGERPYTPCYVVEELPPELTQAAEECNEQGGNEAAPEERTDTNGPERHASRDWDLLSLLFEMRQLLGDQVFRMARLEK